MTKDVGSASPLDIPVMPVDSFVCIGVIDSNGDIYPDPPEAVTQVYIKDSDVKK